MRLFKQPITGHRKDHGQSMVEFALILPLLLLLIFGIIEVGRLMVIFSSVQAASREAGRYAAAAGEVSMGTPYYLDSAGINAAARRIAVLAPINSVTITYDHGPGTAVFVPSMPADVRLRDRVNVTVAAPYVPLLGLTSLQPFNITARTSRTIVKEVPVGVASVGENNDTPVVTIITPADGATFDEGDAISFSGSASDTEDGDLTANIVWFANGTQIGTGGSFSINSLTPGEYIIIAQVSDSSHSTGSDTITITVNSNANQPPSVTIIQPTNGSSFEQGETITFTGSSIDDNDGDLSASLQWSSNRDGALGTGTGFSLSNLSVGTHTITAQSTDSEGLVGSDSVIIAITANTPPTIQITSPGDGYHLARTQTVRFIGVASDSVDGDLSANIQWSSSIDGNLGTGSQIDVLGLNLTVGTHTITARVTDSQGNVAQDAITIYVLEGDPPILSISASPANSAGFAMYTYQTGVLITFSGTATDTEDGNISDDIRWYLDGSLVHTGASWAVNTNTLSTGNHIIMARVVDLDLLEAADSIGIVVIGANTPPTVTITNPTTTGPFKSTKGINFQGDALDTEDGDISWKIEWFSSLSGSLGTGASITQTLSITGTHVITATVTDSGGLSAFDTTSIEVKTPVCPTQNGTYYFINDTTNQNYRSMLVWEIPITGISGLSETLKLLSLQMTLSKSGQGVSVIQLQGQTMTPTRTGDTVSIVEQPSITMMSDGSISITYFFADDMVFKNDGPLTVVAAFEDCGMTPTIYADPQ